MDAQQASVEGRATPPRGTRGAVGSWLRALGAAVRELPASRAERFDDLIAALAGVAIFLLCCDPRILRPGEVGWLMSGDPAQHFLGWQFFRNSPLLQFPLGANPMYGDGQSSTIVFTDSLPLLAFLFKPLRSVLPPLFQYDGGWILGCFVLQAFFARRLLRRFTDSRSLPLLGAALFALSPPMIWRLYGHYTLMGHWMILAAYGFYFARRRSAAKWFALLAVATLVHAYLVVMVGALWGADLLRRHFERELGRSAAVREAALTAAGILLLMWTAGYFVVGGGLSGAGYGYFRLNLLSPLDPNGEWSRLLRDQYHVTGEYEGFAYLGIAFLLLPVAALPRLIDRETPLFAWRRHRPLLAVCGGLFLFAISNRIYFGDVKVASYHLPHLVERGFGIFRASGRMFWPVFYLIYLAVLLVSWRGASRKAARRLTAAALVLQLVDMSPALAFYRTRQSEAMTWTTPLTSPFWLEAGKRYRRVLVVPPSNDPRGFVSLARFAAENLLSINSAYFNRFDEAAFTQAAEQLAGAIRANRIDPSALYVFVQRDKLWAQVQARRSPGDFAGVVNGIRVLAPGLGHFARVRGEPEPEPRDRPGRRGRKRRESLP